MERTKIEPGWYSYGTIATVVWETARSAVLGRRGWHVYGKGPAKVFPTLREAEEHIRKLEASDV